MTNTIETTTTKKMVDKLVAAWETGKAHGEYLRVELAKNTAIRNTEMLMSDLHEIAKAETAATIYVDAADILDRRGVAAVTGWATRKLITGPDDRWSGRGNDLARVKFEGTCAAIERVLEIIEA